MTKLSRLITSHVVLAFCALSVISTSAQTFKTLLSFDGIHGSLPYFVSLVQGHDGELYGTTSLGGSNGLGTVFKVTANGTLTTLHEFDIADGSLPYSSLLLSDDGSFYGTTYVGGSDLTDCNSGCGTVFRITPSGTLTTLYNFHGSDGAYPLAGLVQGTDGNFYGTTNEGGTDYDGTIFKITPQGTLTTLHSFVGTDGAYPIGGLLQGSDGNVYGTTSDGGGEKEKDKGTIFRITRSGKFTTLQIFDNANGANPYGTLMQAINGNVYGTTAWGGANDSGTVFTLTSGNDLTTLHSFDQIDGALPFGKLVQGNDGNFYGTTSQGDTNVGTAFQITPDGILTTLHSFDGTDGTGPRGGLAQATNGKFYGTTFQGGDGNDGTIYSLDMGLGPFVSFVQPFGKVGQTGGILGQGFTGTTSVQLNGVPAMFTIVSDTFIKATVPPGATTGYVTVTTPTGVLTSNVQLHVIP